MRRRATAPGLAWASDTTQNSCVKWQDAMAETTQAMAPETDDESFLHLCVRMPDGTMLRPEALPGFNLVELLRAYGIAMKAECGGAGVCATCHVRIGPAWIDRLVPPSDEEVAKLDEIADSDERSRLACQIRMTEALDGLELELHPDSVTRRSAPVA